MRAVEVVVMEVERETGGAVVTGVVGAGVGPLTGDGLDETFGLAIGLWAVRSGEAMLDAELLAGGGEEFGAVSGAAIGEEALDGDAVVLVESESLMESGEGAGDFFIREQAGESEAGVVIDGDVEGFDAGAGIAVRTIAGGADAGAGETAELFNIQMKEFARVIAFVTDDGRFGIQGVEAMEAVAAENAGERGFGDGESHLDLGVGTALLAERNNLGFELGGDFARLMPGSGRLILESDGESLGFGAGEPAADGFFADAEGGGGSAEGAMKPGVIAGHLGSCERSEFGISVHVGHKQKRWVESRSTTSLPEPQSADNVLKHDN